MMVEGEEAKGRTCLIREPLPDAAQFSFFFYRQTRSVDLDVSGSQDSAFSPLMSVRGRLDLREAFLALEVSSRERGRFARDGTLLSSV